MVRTMPRLVDEALPDGSNHASQVDDLPSMIRTNRPRLDEALPAGSSPATPTGRGSPDGSNHSTLLSHPLPHGWDHSGPSR